VSLVLKFVTQNDGGLCARNPARTARLRKVKRQHGDRAKVCKLFGLMTITTGGGGGEGDMNLKHGTAIDNKHTYTDFSGFRRDAY
jgi:hypothetical protein